jgi:ribosomal protein L37AE/L43A
MSITDGYHGHDNGHRCPRCGETQQRGFRFFKRGIGYCDACIRQPATWVVGPGFYQGAGGVPMLETW